jgi:hypothetical protein
MYELLKLHSKQRGWEAMISILYCVIFCCRYQYWASRMKIQVIDGLQAIKHVTEVTRIYKRNYNSLTIRITGD